jgi:hypothetical protein
MRSAVAKAHSHLGAELEISVSLYNPRRGRCSRRAAAYAEHIPENARRPDSTSRAPFCGSDTYGPGAHLSQLLQTGQFTERLGRPQHSGTCTFDCHDGNPTTADMLPRPRLRASGRSRHGLSIVGELAVHGSADRFAALRSGARGSS